MEELLKRLIPEDIEIEFHLDKKPLFIEINPQQLTQLVINLVTNARDAIKAQTKGTGKIVIETGLKDFSRAFNTKDVEYCYLRIKDTGIGMDEETIKRIFEPFYTTKKSGRGTGLGLSTVYGIVSQAKGYIEVNSQVGKGTVFTIYFPICKAPIEEAKKKNKRNKKEINIEKNIETEKTYNGHILIVEDDPEILKLVSNYLKEIGFKVSQASNGKEALEMLKREDFFCDLVITDQIMPGLSGRELYEKVKILRPKMKFIFVSGYSNIFENGFPPEVRFLPKPYSLDKLVREIKDVLT